MGSPQKLQITFDPIPIFTYSEGQEFGRSVPLSFSSSGSSLSYGFHCRCLRLLQWVWKGTGTDRQTDDWQVADLCFCKNQSPLSDNKPGNSWEGHWKLLACGSYFTWPLLEVTSELSDKECWDDRCLFWLAITWDLWGWGGKLFLESLSLWLLELS